MKHPGWAASSLAGVIVVAAVAVGCRSMKPASASAVRVRQTINFDPHWCFHKGRAPGAQQPGFNDTAWRRLDVPHDWSIEGPFSRTNSTGGAGGFLPAGVGWYRKHFTLPAADAGKRVFIEFDGVMANSDVWINGHHLGHRPYGYVSFVYELTPYATYGAGRPNVLAVRADNSKQPASRWYEGAGIYRHVHLIVTDPVHITEWGTFVTTPQVSATQATVHVRSAVTNESNLPRQVFLQIRLIAPNGRTVATAETRQQTIPAGASLRLGRDLTVKQPQRWDLNTPVLYHALVTVRSDSGTLDDNRVAFGIRSFHFAAATGFWLNGRNFKIKGVCVHDDGSAFGMAVPMGVWQRRLKALKKIGVNAIRTAHNPPDPRFLDLCDRMGFLVMDEFFDCWTVGKNRYDYHLYFRKWSKIDERESVRRDRNHPSIILYSVGNEIHDTPKQELAKRILKGLVQVCHETDPTRPVTMALFRPNVSHDYDDGLADMLDVIGTNYRDNELLAAHRAKPSRKIIGTEQSHSRQTWLICRDHPAEAGQFLWTGVDYLGESRRWPVVAAGSGLLDRTGTPRPLAFQRQSWWSDKPMVYITRRVAPRHRRSTDPGFSPLDHRQVLFSDWTPHDLKPHTETVEVYSNCKEVELFLNGKSLGSKPLPADASPRDWEVTFQPGTLEAVGRDGGKVVARYKLRTAGKPAKILLTPDHRKLALVWDDVSYVQATVVDAKGVRIPRAHDLITFHITGPGVIVAVDSADNSSHEPFQSNHRRTYEGRCFAIVKADGPQGRIQLTASAPGLKGASVAMRAIPPRDTTLSCAGQIPKYRLDYFSN